MTNSVLRGADLPPLAAIASMYLGNCLRLAFLKCLHAAVQDTQEIRWVLQGPCDIFGHI